MKYPNTSDLVAIENVNIYMNYPAGEERKRMKAILESKNSTDASGLIMKMYAEVQRKAKGYDTTVIDASRGNIHRIDDWDTTAKAMEAINKFLGKYEFECVDLMNDLYDMIVGSAQDFEFGYQYKITIIQILYQTMVLELYEIIDMCICCYTDMLRNPSQKKPKFGKLDATHSSIVRSAEGLVSTYKSGEWKRTMKALKDPKIAAKESAIFGTANESAVTIIAIAAFAIVGFKMILGFIRIAVNYFFAKSVSIAEYLENQADLLKTAIESEERIGDTSDAVLQKQRKWLNRLEATAGFINSKILKTEKKADDEMRKENKQYLTAVDGSVSMTDANAFAII